MHCESAAAGITAAALPLEGLAHGRGPVAAKSVIVLWMAGGLTHHDSFDPKPDAPEQIRGSLTTIPTALPGVRFTEVMPNMAKAIGDIALVRTYASGNDDHLLSQAGAAIRPQSHARSVDDRAEHRIHRLEALRAAGRLPRIHRRAGHHATWSAALQPVRRRLARPRILPRSSPAAAPKNEDFTAFVKEPPEDEFHKQGLSHLPGMDTARYQSRQSLREQLEDDLRKTESGPDPLAANYRGALRNAVVADRSPGV